MSRPALSLHRASGSGRPGCYLPAFGMNPLWLLRMARWAKHPPSDARVKLVLAVIAISLLLFGYEWLFGWPEWLTPNKVPRGRF